MRLCDARAIAQMLGFRLVEPRLGNEAARRQLAKARQVERGTMGLRLGAAQRGHRLLDDRTLLREAACQVVEHRAARGDAGGRLVYARAVVAVVDREQDVPRLDRLVVADRDCGDIAADLRADRGDIALHVGVAGGGRTQGGDPSPWHCAVDAAKNTVAATARPLKPALNNVMVFLLKGWSAKAAIGRSRRPRVR